MHELETEEMNGAEGVSTGEGHTEEEHTGEDASVAGEVIFNPCPFCGEVPEPTKHFREEMWQLIHRCSKIGAIAIDWRASKATIAKCWNVANPFLGLSDRDLRVVWAAMWAAVENVHAPIDTLTGEEYDRASELLEKLDALVEQSDEQPEGESEEEA